MTDPLKNEKRDEEEECGEGKTEREEDKFRVV